jgi:hypothetical protein
MQIPGNTPAFPAGVSHTGHARAHHHSNTQPATTFAGTVRAAVAKPATAPASEPAMPVSTDPRLWAVLSSDERAHFAQVGAMGPLSYGRASASMRGVTPRGARLSVRG